MLTAPQVSIEIAPAFSPAICYARERREGGLPKSMAIAEISPLTDTSLNLLELRHRRRESALHQLVHSAFEHQAVRHSALL